MPCLIDAGPLGTRRVRNAQRRPGLLCFLGGLLLCFAGATPGNAQSLRPAGDGLRMRAALAAHASAAQPALRRPAAGHYDVVALRVEFQPDTTRFTTGDGTFDGDLFGDSLQPSVDPLPHDAAYFEAHLAFLEDYVRRVSDGKTQLTTHLLPQVVRLSKPMGAYSPTGPNADSDDELRKLASLVTEAWTLAEAQRTTHLAGLDPERTAFVLFHAGVGRDIELLGTTLDKTPEDLPSLFFDQRALERLLGPLSLTFDGVPVRHSILIPRTESRRGMDFIQDQPFLLELSINGMLAASFFNFLGVPDLFDTSSGESAIGPFGLMDPLGIFAYRGLFPPEPTGWTKYYLGWTEPYELDAAAGPVSHTLRAASLPESSDLARATISGAEYFLIENRYRDPEGDGLVLRVWKDGRIQEQRVQNGDETFNDLDISGFIGGVVVGVDNYDWALPGGVDENGNELNGGILIWHVDERRLLEGLADNRVNADRERRTLDLEEADGAQDIGFPSGSTLGPEFHLGSPFDFFYEGNPVSVENQVGQIIRLYQNRFGPDTYPNSNSNAGGPSFVTLADFSPPGPEMTFVYRQATEGGVAPVFSGTLRGPFGAGASLLGVTDGGLLIHDGTAGSGNLRIVELDPASLEADYRYSVLARPGLGPEGGAVLLVPEAEASAIRFAAPADLFDPFRWEQWTRVPLEVSLQLEARSPVITADPGAWVLFGDGTQQVLVRADRSGNVERTPLGRDAVALVRAAGQPPLLVGHDGAYFVSGTEPVWTFDLSADVVLGDPAVGRDRSGLVGVVPLPEQRRFLWLLADGSVREQTLDPHVVPEGAMNRSVVLVDLDDDGFLDALTTVGKRLVAYSQQGAVVPGFPLAIPAPVVAQPLVAELTESGGWSVVLAATDGYVYAFDLGREGAPVPGFPLALGRRIEATPVLHDGTLYAVSTDGDLKAWDLAGVGEVWWSQHYGNAQNTSYVALTVDSEPGPSGGDLLVDAETYNWPNPIRGGFTHFRYQTTADARIEILIVDAAGGRVDEITVEQVRGGVPGEVRWQTEASSGLYFARITATGADGRKQTRIVKMAIIR